FTHGLPRLFSTDTSLNCCPDMWIHYNRQAQHTLEKIKSSTNADVQQKTVLLSGNKITPIVTEVLAAVDTDSIKQGEEKVEPVQRPISASNKDVLISFAFLVLLCYLIWHFILAPLGHFVFGTSGKFLYGQYLSAGNNAIEFFDEKYIDGEVLEEKRTENGRCYFGWIELKSTAVLGQPLISKHTNILYIFTYEQDGRYWTGFRGLNYIDDLRQSWEEYQCGEFPKGRK
ncbi:hypothetical protein QN363_19630, partial [Undibacterium sp. CCC2.1]|uniref:hypothetical protein n=2 Tax=Undibacterium TaxID=401469 RepID=UPI002B23C802